MNQDHTSNLLIPSVPLNPKFADEVAAKSSELRIRDTRHNTERHGLLKVNPRMAALQ